MAAAVRLRSDFDGTALRRLARASRDAKQVLRLLVLAAIYEGERRSEAARISGVALQIVRDWVMRFNAKGLAELMDRRLPGCRPMLSADQRRALAAIVKAGPIPTVHGVVRWRPIDLAQWVWDEFALSISKQMLSRELRALGYRRSSGGSQRQLLSRYLPDIIRRMAVPKERYLKVAALLMLAAGFAGAAAATRFTLQHTESHAQIAGWIGAAGLAAVIMPGRAADDRLLAIVLFVCACTFGVVAMKDYLEPGAIKADAHVARAEMKRAVQETPFVR